MGRTKFILHHLRDRLHKDVFSLVKRKLTATDVDMCIRAHGGRKDEPLDSLFFKDCGYYGQLERLQWGLNGRYNGVEFSLALEYAAKAGHLHILQWGSTKRLLRTLGLLSTYAASGGHLHVLKWLAENECWFRMDTVEEAAREDHLETLKYLVEEVQVPFDRYRVQKLARGSCLEYMKEYNKIN